MSWAKLDDGCYFHGKVVAAGNEAFGCFCRLLAWSSHHLTDGTVPSTVALAIALDARVLEKLCAVGMLSVDGDDYSIHDYLEYNPSAREVAKQRESVRKQRSLAGRASATKRQRERNGAVDLSCNKRQPRPDPSRPDPSRPDLERERESARESDGDRVTLEAFSTAIANAGISISLGRADQERFSRLFPVERFELDHALDCAREAKAKRASYVLQVIEGDRQKAEDESRGPRPPKARRRESVSAGIARACEAFINEPLPERST